MVICGNERIAAADVACLNGWFAKWHDPFRKLQKSRQIVRVSQPFGLIYDFADRILHLRCCRQPGCGGAEPVSELFVFLAIKSLRFGKLPTDAAKEGTKLPPP